MRKGARPSVNSNRMIIIAGWAHTPEDLSPLCALLSPKYDIQVTSTAKLFSTTDPAFQSLPPASQYAKALYGLVSKHKEPQVIVAWSMGALVAIEAVSKLSPTISRLILISGTARFCADADYPHGISEQNIRAMSASLQKRPEEILSGFFRDSMFPETDATQKIERKTRKALSLTPACLNDGLTYLRKNDLRNVLPGIHVPTLVIHGAQDKIIPVSASEFLAKNIPSSRLIVHQDTGHTLILDRPALIAEDIRTFMEE